MRASGKSVFWQLCVWKVQRGVYRNKIEPKCKTQCCALSKAMFMITLQNPLFVLQPARAVAVGGVRHLALPGVLLRAGAGAVGEGRRQQPRPDHRHLGHGHAGLHSRHCRGAQSLSLVKNVALVRDTH